MAETSSTVAQQGSVASGDLAGNGVVEDRQLSYERALRYQVDNVAADTDTRDAATARGLAVAREQETRARLGQTLANLPARYQTPVVNPIDQPDKLLRDLEKML